MNIRLDLEKQNKNLYVISYFDPIKRSTTTITRDDVKEANTLARVLHTGNYLSVEMYEVIIEIAKIDTYLEST